MPPGLGGLPQWVIDSFFPDGPHPHPTPDLASSHSYAAQSSTPKAHFSVRGNFPAPSPGPIPLPTPWDCCRHLRGTWLVFWAGPGTGQGSQRLEQGDLVGGGLDSPAKVWLLLSKPGTGRGKLLPHPPALD